MNVVEIKNLSKKYGDFLALDNINLTVESHQIVGLVGPNGAGKTTMIKLICSMLLPTNGSIKVFGQDVTKDVTYKENIGYLGENIGYYENFTAYNYLRFFGTFYRMNGEKLKKTGIEVLKTVGLLNQSNSKISTFSRGMKQRLGLARCLLHEPDLLILDEPMSGLDPTGKKDIMEKLIDIRDSGKTIFLSSHELRYMDDVCDQICVIKNGKIIAHGTPDTILTDIKGMSNYVILLKSRDKKIDELQRVFPEIRELSVKQNILHLRVKETKDFEKKFLTYLLQNNIDFSIKTHKIDAIYSQIFEEKT